MGSIDDCPVVKAAVPDARVEDVAFGTCGGFQRVVDRLPTQFGAVGCAETDPEMVDRQRLYDILLFVLESEETQNPFVDGSAHGEPEARVESVAHVGEILVGEQFE